jgi:hypothetical protein
LKQRALLLFLGLAAPLIFFSFLLDHPISEAIFAFLATLFPLALMALGASRRGHLGRLGFFFLRLALILLSAVGGMFFLRGRVTELPWLWGLPLTAALQIYLVFWLPLGLVSLAYGLSFENQTLRQEDLDALRRLRGPGPRADDPGES